MTWLIVWILATGQVVTLPTANKTECDAVRAGVKFGPAGSAQAVSTSWGSAIAGGVPAVFCWYGTPETIKGAFTPEVTTPP
jgi:hypothetical protein